MAAAAVLMLCGASVAAAQDLVILHTNDTHSQIDVQRTGEYAGLGGAERRYELFQSVISKYGREIVLLLDAGDYNQGSSYFTEYGGDVEMKIMNALGYDVVTLGNHEFDNGIDDLARRLSKADFQTVCCNYSFKGTPLDKYVKPYVILTKGDKRIGIIGVTTELEKVTDAGIVKDLKRLDPVKSVNKYAKMLARKCDLVILLSHRGFEMEGVEDTDMDPEMASKLSNVDIIIGGHTHTFLDGAKEFRNADGERTVVVQDGWGGINVGMLVIDRL